jgi:hypothetical protein
LTDEGAKSVMDSDALLSNNDDIISKREDTAIDRNKEDGQGFQVFIDSGENDESRLSSLFTNDNNTTNMQYINFASGRKDSESFH